MQARSTSLGARERKEMAFEPPVECPICRETLEPDRVLEDHLLGKHTHREVVEHFVTHRERAVDSTIAD